LFWGRGKSGERREWATTGRRNRMKKTKFDITYDVRLIDRNIQEGLLDKNAYEKHLKKLKDREDNAVPIVIDEDEEEEGLEAKVAEEASEAGGEGDEGIEGGNGDKEE